MVKVFLYFYNKLTNKSYEQSQIKQGCTNIKPVEINFKTPIVDNYNV